MKMMALLCAILSLLALTTDVSARKLKLLSTLAPVTKVRCCVVLCCGRHRPHIPSQLCAAGGTVLSNCHQVQCVLSLYMAGCVCCCSWHAKRCGVTLNVLLLLHTFPDPGTACPATVHVRMYLYDILWRAVKTAVAQLPLWLTQ